MRGPAPLVLERLNTLKPLHRARRKPRLYYFANLLPIAPSKRKKRISLRTSTAAAGIPFPMGCLPAGRSCPLQSGRCRGSGVLFRSAGLCRDSDTAHTSRASVCETGGWQGAGCVRMGRGTSVPPWVGLISADVDQLMNHLDPLTATATLKTWSITETATLKRSSS